LPIQKKLDLDMRKGEPLETQIKMNTVISATPLSVCFRTGGFASPGYPGFAISMEKTTYTPSSSKVKGNLEV